MNKETSDLSAWQPNNCAGRYAYWKQVLFVWSSMFRLVFWAQTNQEKGDCHFEKPTGGCWLCQKLLCQGDRDGIPRIRPFTDSLTPILTRHHNQTSIVECTFHAVSTGVAEYKQDQAMWCQQSPCCQGSRAEISRINLLCRYKLPAGRPELITSEETVQAILRD